MGLKAGWIALFLFVWVIGAFLGSTFDYQVTPQAAGISYSTGNVTITNGSTAVTGMGTLWTADMEDGNITANADSTWTKILSIDSATTLTLYSPYTGTGGVAVAYTMRPTPGWAGTGGGGYETAPVSKLEYLMSAFEVLQRSPLVGTFKLVTSSTFWGVAYQIVTWQWSFMDGYEMFYWIFCMPFVVMGVLSMILLVYGILTGNISWG